MKPNRREFLKNTFSTLAAAELLQHQSIAQFLSQKASGNGMPLRALGNTGHSIRLFSLGGQSTLEESGKENLSEEIINRAIDLGVNYIDTAAAYGNGTSETSIGKVMKARRRDVYLASKTHDRSYSGSMRLLERSLKNLQTDYLDCWQVHNVRADVDLEKMFAKDGVMKAMRQAREEKTVRFLGITGHRDPHVLAEGLRRFHFDTILMALNAADVHFNSFIEQLLPIAVEKSIGIIGMKIPARGRIFRDGGIATMEQAMRYVLTLPVSTVIVGIDTIEHLEENVNIARNFSPLSEAEMNALERKTMSYHEEAAWYKHRW